MRAACPVDLEEVVVLLGCSEQLKLALNLIEAAWPWDYAGKREYSHEVLEYYSTIPDAQSASAPDTLCSLVPDALSVQFRTPPMRR